MEFDNLIVSEITEEMIDSLLERFQAVDSKNCGVPIMFCSSKYIKKLKENNKDD